MRQLFADAAAAAPSILFIDEIDAIAPKRENAQREMERRIVAQMLTCMDDLAAPPAPIQDSDSVAAEAAGGGSTIRPQIRGGNSQGFGVFGDGSAAAAAATAAAADRQASGAQVRHVVVIGATNRPDALDPALRRAGRFDREISLGIPGQAAREQMLKVLCRGLRLQPEGVDLHGIARATPGYVGADLSALTKEAAALAVSRTFEALESSRRNQAAVATTAPEGAATVATPSTCDVEMHEPSQLADADAEKETQQQPEAAADAGNNGAITVQEQPSKRQGLRWRGPLTAEELQHVAITGDDFQGALAKVQPSVRREGFSTKPDVTWADVVRLLRCPVLCTVLFDREKVSRRNHLLCRVRWMGLKRSWSSVFQCLSGIQSASRRWGCLWPLVFCCSVPQGAAKRWWPRRLLQTAALISFLSKARSC